MFRPARRVATVTAAAALAFGLAACDTVGSGASTDYVTDGTFTVATGEPAYPPYVLDDDPSSGEGFESAVAYAVAAELGFAAEDVVWVRATWDETIAPGPKDYDINLQQVTISDDRAGDIDFTSPYYTAPQAIITVAGSAADGITSISELAGLQIGAATGTTSLTTIEEVVQPGQAPAVFNSNDDAVLALQNNQVDAIVVDLPTALYLTAAVLDSGVVLGQFPVGPVGDQWGIVLEKNSPLTTRVSAAVDAIIASGELERITTEWMSDWAGAPILAP
jgi:polar amino acid transport system substrate-binding protein